MRRDLTWLRVGLPLALAFAGVLLAVTVSTVLGLALVAAAVAVVVANLYIRLSFSSQDDRAREAQARRTFERTGRWPE